MSKTKDSLPENAFRPLNEGEEYVPLMESGTNPKEVTAWSVVWGLVMAVIFSAAAAYLGLKVGQVFEAAIPITIIAVGLSSATKRKGALGENVMIQSIGACSGVVVAGAIFTLPALYILQAKYPEMTVNFMEVFIASLLGGILGILFLIPFRKYFVKEMHGKYPFPEATASTQILVSGEKGGGQAKPLLIAGLLGGLYDFAVSTFGLWNEAFASRAVLWGDTVAEKAKLVFKMNTGAAVLGMGYIVGFKYALIICMGSAAVWWIIVPGIALIWPELQIADNLTAAAASPEEIFKYAKSIGIGGIAMAGIIGIILVMLFMIVMYRLPGVVSALALVAYIALTCICLVLFKVNLSLPAIAGIFLTIGMAVDANVVIFERIKEELNAGKSVKAAVKAGFNRAFTAIIDSNITTLIAAVVLWYFGTGAIQGFAVTLFLGVVLSLITALFITKVLLNALVGMGVTNIKLFGAKSADKQ